MTQWSRYNISVTGQKNEMLLFNVRTGALVRLNSDRTKEIENPDIMSESFISFLLNQGFLVSNDFDEIAGVIKMHENARKDQRSFSATIELTESCNFRCCYCYQSHATKHLNSKIEDRIIAFLYRNMAGINHLHINWFGGEPLLKIKTLERMSRSLAEKAREKGCHFTQFITTNGYLMTTDVSRLLAELGVKNVQITLDGDKETHDQMRQLKSKRGTYEKVLQGCKNVVSAGIELMVRVNVNRDNADRIGGLLRDLSSYGISGKNAIIHAVRMINHGNCDEKTAATLYSNAEFAQKWLDILKLVSDYGFGLPTLEPRAYNCMFDLSQTVMIGHDGHIRHCSSSDGYLSELHDNGCEINIGPLYTKIKDRRPTDDPKCRICKFLPMCMGGCSYLQEIGQEKCNPEKYIVNELVKLTANQTDNIRQEGVCIVNKRDPD